MNRESRSVLHLLITGFLAGLAFVLIKIVGEEVPPVALSTGRAAIAALVLYVFLRARGNHMPRIGKVWGHFFVVGLLNILLPISLLAFAETEVASGLAAVLASTMPIITIILAYFLVDEPFTLDRIIGILLGFTGVLVTLVPTLGGKTHFSLIGIAAILAAAFLLALSATYVRLHLQTVPPIQTVVGMATCATVVGVVITVLTEHPTHIRPDSGQLLAWLGLGVFCSALLYFLYFGLITTRGPAFATLALFIQPPVAIILSAIVFHTTIRWATIVGMAIILFSVAIMDGYLDPVFYGKKPAIETDKATDKKLVDDELEMDDL